ncbi:hypothetical protein BGZ83_005908 [Gryganskiella cystojenkinii]|nr:hypothetical protein BGZ83_005908 [Gryganskiella cystojenkinii]
MSTIYSQEPTTRPAPIFQPAPPPPPPHPSPERPHALAIPEIIILVGEYMDNRSLTICLCVSKQWHRVLLPRFWHSLELSFGDPEPSFEVFQKHSHLIRELVIFAMYNLVYYDGDDLVCPNLQVLEINQASGEFFCKLYDPDLEDLLSKHQSTVRTLSVQIETSPGMWNDLTEYGPQLKELFLEQAVFDTAQQWKELYKNLWSRLTKLTMGYNRLEEGERGEEEEEEEDDTKVIYRKSTEEGEGENVSVEALLLQLASITFQSDEVDLVIETFLQDLSLCNSHEGDVETMIRLQCLLIQNSPELTRLRWETDWNWHDPDMMPMAMLATAINSGTCRPRKLKHLLLANAPFCDPDFKVVLEAMTTTGLTTLYLNRTGFGSGSWSVLKNIKTPHHLTTLQALHVGEPGVTGEMVQEILTSMPNLEVFESGMLQGSDLLADTRPWVCTKMTSLSLGFEPTRNGTIDEDLFLSRLGRLERLEDLNLGIEYTTGLRPYRLMLVQEDEQGNEEGGEKRGGIIGRCGLDLLKSLRRLKYLTGPSDKYFTWTIAEARWALEHWPRLEELSEVDVESKACRLLIDHNVTLHCY